MINNKKFFVPMTVLALVLSLTSATAAFAETTPSTVKTAKSAKVAERFAAEIKKSDEAIEKRITSLNEMKTRVAEMEKVSPEVKAKITASVDKTISELGTIKTQVAGATDTTTLASAAKSITAAERVYALVLPQARITAAADKVATLGELLNGVSAKLQARITEAQTAGKDVVTLQTSLTAMNAKIAAAVAAGKTAETSVANLVPDNGDKTILASNTAALKTARANLELASQDLKEARKIVETIYKGIKALK